MLSKFKKKKFINSKTHFFLNPGERKKTQNKLKKYDLQMLFSENIDISNFIVKMTKKIIKIFLLKQFIK